MATVRRHSPKRDAILALLQGVTCHPSAEWIYARLKPEHPDLSLGTVYRNLSLFRESGEVISVGTVAGQERYDGDTSAHSHFICRCCGAVLDVEAFPLPGDAYLELREKYGLRPQSHGLTFYGLCGSCREPGESL